MKFILLILILASCGNPLQRFAPKTEVAINSDNYAVSENFSYRFEERDCIAHQSAPTLQKICSVMLNEKLNNACAKFQREELYMNECES